MIGLAIHLLVNNWAVSHFFIIMKKAVMYNHASIFGLQFACLLCKHSGVKLLGHGVVAYITLKGICQTLSSKVVVQFH